MVGFKGAGCDLIVFGTIIRDTITGYATARKLGITADVVVTQAGFDTMVAGFPGGITEGLYAASVGEAVYCDSAPASAKAFVMPIKRSTALIQVFQGNWATLPLI